MKRFLYVSLLCFAILVVGVWGDINQRQTSYYCRHCGMRRTVDEWDWLGLTHRKKAKNFPTGYSELYFRGVTSPCTHKWVFYRSYSTGGLFANGEIGCGAYSEALRYAPLLHRVRNLAPSKIPVLLRAFPLKSVVLSAKERKKMNNAVDALSELPENPGRKELELWWQQQHKLF